MDAPCEKQREFAAVRILDTPYQADRSYAYYIPDSLSETARPGSLVGVPFGRGNRKRTGVITSVTDSCELENVKPIDSVSGIEPLLDGDALGMCRFLSDYTLCTFGEAVKTVIPSAALTKMCDYFSAAPDKDPVRTKKLSDKALMFYTFIKARGSVSASRLKSEFGDEASTLAATLVRNGYILKEEKIKEPGNTSYITYVRLSDCDECREIGLTAAQMRSRLQKDVFLLLSRMGRITIEELCARLGKNVRVQVASLEKKGLVTVEKIENYRNPYLSAANGDDPYKGTTLSDEQTEAYKKLDTLYSGGNPAAALLHGVTGSGKTRVIKAMIDRVTADGRGVIILVPEISLTPQTVGIFCGCYGERVAVIHSNLSQGERFDAWRRIKRGDADIVIGTRSAIFAPLKNIGMIVIDEEQEHTYKSDTDPKYLAHDVARYRCGHHKALMLLSSATPSLLSYHKAKTGAYSLVELNSRFGAARLPEVIISDMRAETEGGGVSPIGSILREKLCETYKAGKQSIVFLNRRGYNSAVSCRICGEAIKCPNCSVSLTYHTRLPLGESTSPEEYRKIRSERGVLACHYCGYRTKVPDTCPSCHSEHFRYMGCGTQQAEEEIKKLLPSAGIIRMDMDTTQSKTAHRKLLGQFREGKAEILLGTQMVTKGHDFPNVTLVGVMNADSSLYLDDYRAAERTFSMLTQVIGRAGRADDAGIAVVQTSNPDSEVIRLAAMQDYKTFYEKEIRLRRALVFPPFCDIAIVTVQSTDEALLSASALKLSEKIREMLSGEFSDVKAMIFGPFEAPVYKVQNTCRMRMVMKCGMNKRTRAMLSELIGTFGKSGAKNLTLSVDINPTSL